MKAANRHVYKQSFSHNFKVFLALPTCFPKPRTQNPELVCFIAAQYVVASSPWGTWACSTVRPLMPLGMERHTSSQYFIILLSNLQFTGQLSGWDFSRVGGGRCPGVESSREGFSKNGNVHYAHSSDFALLEPPIHSAATKYHFT